jgi:hypothetical protein
LSLLNEIALARYKPKGVSWAAHLILP